MMEPSPLARPASVRPARVCVVRCATTNYTQEAATHLSRSTAERNLHSLGVVKQQQPLVEVRYLSMSKEPASTTAPNPTRTCRWCCLAGNSDGCGVLPLTTPVSLSPFSSSGFSFDFSKHVEPGYLLRSIVTVFGIIRKIPYPLPVRNLLHCCSAVLCCWLSVV